MSIAITDVSEFGIVMVTDTALLEEISDVEQGNRFGNRSRVLFGARKLFGHPPSVSGLAIWGAGTLPGPIATQFVIEKFLEDHAAVRSVDVLSDELAYILRTFYSAGTAPLGVQVGGMIKGEAGWMPALYEVRNSDGPGSPLYEFKLHTIRPPKTVTSPEDRILYPGGDLTLYRPLSQALDGVIDQVGQKGYRIPEQSLQARRDFFAAQVRFISDLYASGRMLRTIGGDVLVLSIDNGGFLYLP